MVEHTTSALAFGGESCSATADTELWNGTNWTEVNNLNTCKRWFSRLQELSNTSALAVWWRCTPSAVSAVTETWNGTNWTEVGDLNTARDNI